MELPVIQAGMGGGLAGHAWPRPCQRAAAWGRSVCSHPPSCREIAAAGALSDKPLAVNLLLPFARRAHVKAAALADVLVTSWGRPERRTPNARCISAAQARRRSRRARPGLTR